MDLSGESTNLISDAVVPSSLVESGCEMYGSLHPGKKCTHDLCSNHGTCVQQWNSYTCDCDMTSFTGPTCNEGKRNTGYTFGYTRVHTCNIGTLHLELLANASIDCLASPFSGVFFCGQWAGCHSGWEEVKQMIHRGNALLVLTFVREIYRFLAAALFAERRCVYSRGTLRMSVCC